MSIPDHESPPAMERSALFDLRLVLLLMAVCFLGHFNRISMAVAADLQIMRELEISKTQMGVVYSAFLVAYTLAMIPCGWLIDRRGPRFTLGMVWFGSAMFVALTAAVSFVSTALAALAMLLVIRSLMGVVSAPLHPGSATAVGLYLPAAHRSRANGFITGAALAGVAATYPVFGWLIDMLGWPAAFVVMASVTAAFGALWMTYGPRRSLAAEPSTAPVAPTVRNLEPQLPVWVRHRNLALLTLSYGAIGYFQYLFFYWVHTYFTEVLKVGEDRSRNYAAIPPLAMAVGMPLGGWLSDWIQLHYGWRAARVGLGFVTMSTSAALLWLGVQTTEPVLEPDLSVAVARRTRHDRRTVLGHGRRSRRRSRWVQRGCGEHRRQRHRADCPHRDTVHFRNARLRLADGHNGRQRGLPGRRRLLAGDSPDHEATVRSPSCRSCRQPPAQQLPSPDHLLSEL